MSAVLSLDNSRRLDMIVRRGASFDKALLVKNAADNTDFDFTGWTGELKAFSSIADTNADLTFSAAGGLTLATGSITLSKSDTVMNKFRRHDYFYFLWMTSPAGKKKLWLNGLFSVQEGLYDDETDSNELLITLTGDDVTLSISSVDAGIEARVAELESDAALYGPYASLAAARLAVPSGERANRTVLIAGVEYWWKDGITDNDLVEKAVVQTLIQNIVDENTRVTLEVTDNINGYMHARVKSTSDSAGGGLILGQGQSVLGVEQLPILTEGMMALEAKSATSFADNTPGFFTMWVTSTGIVKFNFRPLVGDPVAGELIRSGIDNDSGLDRGLRIKDDNGNYKTVRIDVGGSLYVE
jgi:hypothetical protein